ncbi:MAG: SDR family NAD(P)-dependent oxidoreductase [Woeseiaceae bacterium]|nr:SDR family NAD(P)-dependent oxidoreductase [Woeseiaceae bacterium]
MRTTRRTLLRGAAAALAASALAACGREKHPSPDVPRSGFDEDSTAEQVTEGIDLTGRLAVVTGCTSGIGFETMRVLALRGAYVVGTSRSLERAEAACRQVAGVTSPVALDLGSVESVLACAAAIRTIGAPIDMLICNAGYRGGGNDIELVNGVEKHFAINHLGHFLLVNRLLDRLYPARQGRVVVVASRASYRAAPDDGIRFDDLTLGDDYSDDTAYGQSKLANVLFAHGLAARLKGTRITANSLHPGLINTEIDRNVNRFLQFAFGALAAVSGKSIEEGAATTCYVATSPQLDATSGEYFEDCNAVRVEDSLHHDAVLSDTLWQLSASLLAPYLVDHARPEQPAAGDATG